MIIMTSHHNVLETCGKLSEIKLKNDYQVDILDTTLPLIVALISIKVTIKVCHKSINEK